MTTATGRFWRFFRKEPLLLCALAISGCAHHDAVSSADVAAGQAEPSNIAAPQSHLDRAVELLQTGEAAKAREELTACLAETPDSKTARELLAEIETPIAQLYPKDGFTVVLGRNETLSGVAAKYLGDPLAFYGLARYNGIAEPAKVVAGQRIRIPKTATSVAALENPATASSDSTTPPLRTDPTADTPNMRGVEQATDAAPNLTKAFNAAFRAGRFVDAARTADSDHFDRHKVGAATLAVAWLRAAEAEKQLDAASAAEHARKAATLYLQVLKDPEKARSAFQLALSVRNDDTAARAGLEKATNWLATVYYHQATVCFQRQDLDGAIRAWDKLLAIKPDDRDAQLNRAQALQLKANLQKLRG